MYFCHVPLTVLPLISSSAHLVIFGDKSDGVFALAAILGSASVSDLGSASASGAFAGATGASAWVMASAMIRPALSGSLRIPARRTSPSVVFISFVMSVLSAGL